MNDMIAFCSYKLAFFRFLRVLVLKELENEFDKSLIKKS